MSICSRRPLVTPARLALSQLCLDSILYIHPTVSLIVPLLSTRAQATETSKQLSRKCLSRRMRSRADCVSYRWLGTWAREDHTDITLSVLQRQVDRDPRGQSVQRDTRVPTEMSGTLDQDRLPLVCRRDLYDARSHNLVLWRHQALSAQGCECRPVSAYAQVAR